MKIPRFNVGDGIKKIPEKTSRISLRSQSDVKNHEQRKNQAK
jgi:hypothetical protein